MYDLFLTLVNTGISKLSLNEWFVVNYYQKNSPRKIMKTSRKDDHFILYEVPMHLKFLILIFLI